MLIKGELPVTTGFSELGSLGQLNLRSKGLDITVENNSINYIFCFKKTHKYDNSLSRDQKDFKMYLRNKSPLDSIIVDLSKYLIKRVEVQRYALIQKNNLQKPYDDNLEIHFIEDVFSFNVKYEKEETYLKFNVIEK